VKLQKYKITPFRGDQKDWLRFWNQFSVELDGSNIAEVSKFNYLLELVQEKQRTTSLNFHMHQRGTKRQKESCR